MNDIRQVVLLELKSQDSSRYFEVLLLSCPPKDSRVAPWLGIKSWLYPVLMLSPLSFPRLNSWVKNQIVAMIFSFLSFDKAHMASPTT